MKSRRERPAALALAAMLVLVLNCGGAAAQSCAQLAVDDGFGGELAVSAGNFDPELVSTAEECAALCGQLGTSVAGVETIDDVILTLACLCGNVSVATASSACTSCAGCGGTDGNVWTVPAESDIKTLILVLNVNEQTVSATTNAAVEVVAVVNGANVDFQVSAGDGSPAMFIAGSPGEGIESYITHVIEYFAPGTYVVTVTAQKRGGRAVLAQQLNVTILAGADLLEVTCPTVMEPGEPYYCGAVVSGSGVQVSTAYSDEDVTTDFEAPSTIWPTSGFPPPRSAPANDTNLLAGQTTFILTPSFNAITSIQLVRAFGHATSSGTCTCSLVTPVCTAPEVFCPGSGFCSSSCAALPDNMHQCTTGTFCPLTGACPVGDITAPGDCGTVNPPASFTEVGTMSLTIEAGLHAIGRPIDWIAQPGDMIKVDCAGGGVVAAVATPGAGDLNDAASIKLDQSHLLEVVGVPMVPITTQHTCVTPVENVTFTVTLPGSGVTLAPGTNINQTACEYIIRNASITLVQGGATLAPAVMDGPIYVDSSLPLTVSLSFLEGAPVNMAWDYGTTTLPADTNQLLARVDPTAFYDKIVTYTESGTFVINASATNTHSETLGATWATQEVVVQHPVLPDWTPVLVTPVILAEPRAEPPVPASIQILVKLPETLQLPTDAEIFVHYGDSFPMPEFEPLTEHGLTNDTVPVEGFYQIELNHQYASGGIYTVDIQMKNMISNITLQLTVDVEEKITDFNPQMMFVVQGVLQGGLGDDENEFHNDKNISFVMSLSQGYVTEYMLYNTSSGEEELLTTFTVPNKTQPTVGEFFYFFDENQLLNLTFKAKNTYEVSDSVAATIWIKDPITEIEGVMIVEGPVVTQRREEKPINITFECASTVSLCMVIDYGDGSPLASYGDEFMCMQNYSMAKFQPNDLTMPMQVGHTYWSNGKYDMTVILYNPVSFSTAELSFLVINFPCPKPILTAEGASETKEKANEYFRSARITVETTMLLDCSVEFTADKRWNITKIDPVTGESLEIIEVEDILPSWNKSVLFLTPKFLDFGMYKLQYILTLYEGEEPPEMPYQMTSVFYIKIIRSPLIAIMVRGSVSRVVRGWGQTVSLNPRENSIDPDMPDDKEFEFEWYCRSLSEEFAMNGTELVSDSMQNVPSPDDPPPTNSNGGCFGQGPGRLDYAGGTWDIDTNIFHPRGQEITFEMFVIIRKNGRKATAFIHIEMVSGKPPMMSIVCADPLLCAPTDGGVYVNPTVRLGLRGECTFDCFPPLTYEWKVSKIEDGQPVPITDVGQYIMSEPGSNELALAAGLFGNYSSIERFHVSLTSNNTHVSQKTGSATFYVVMNKPPVAKEANCRTVLTGHMALRDKMDIECQPPTDPEKHPIVKYEFITKTENPSTGFVRWKTVSTVKTPKINLRMPYGRVTVYYDVSDILGGKTRKKVYFLETLMPSKEIYDEIMLGPEFTQAASSGNVKELAMIMQASETIRESAPWMIQPTLAIGDGEDSAAADASDSISQQNIKATETMANMALVDKGSLDVCGSTLDSILEVATGSPESALQADSKTLKNSLKVALLMSDSLESGVDIATPDELKTPLSGIMTVYGVTAMSSSKIASDEDCKAVPVADMRRADVLEYDVRLGNYDQETEIPDVEKQHACNVRDNSMKDSGENSPKLDNMINSLQNLVASKSVVGETFSVESSSGMKMKTMLLKNMTSMKLEAGESGGSVETGENFNPTGDDEPVALALSDYPTNSKSSASGASSLSPDARVLSMEVKSRGNLSEVAVANLTEPLRIMLPRLAKNVSSDPNCTDCTPAPTFIDTKVALQGKFVPLVYSQFNIPKPDSAFNIEIYPVNAASHRLFVMVSIGRMPTMKSHEFFKMVDDFPIRADDPPDVDAEVRHDWFISSDTVNNRTGRAFVAVGELKDDLDLEATKQKLDTNETIDGVSAKNLLKSNLTTDYFMKTFTTGCYYYNKDWDMWTSEGLRCVGADDRSVTCETSHLTMFGSGFVVEPNTIDFAYVFANASFTDNLTIYMTMIISLVLYFIIAIWARWQDKKDVEKVGARPMPDNKPSDKYLYEVMIFTGHKSNAATDSTVSFILCGDKDETPTRTFGEPKRQFFRKGGQDVFVMACPRPLGDLQYIRIWHDSTGRGRYGSWYLQYIHIRDVQTGQHFDFVGDCWLALEEGDGHIDRLIAVAGKEQLGEFSHLFSHTSQTNLSDGHLWFSIFLRPPRSRFTRLQRVSSCFALLFLSMMVNAMWYGVVPSQPSNGGINFGPMSLSIEQISVGVMSNLIVFPPSFFIVFLFRKARPRTLRKSRIDDALEKQNFGNQVAKSDRPQSAVSRSEKDDKSKKKKKKLSLPWWCSIIAWILCIICLFGSAFIVWAYGIQFGNEKTTKWLTSLLTSFFSSILLIQPIKVFLMATLLSAIFKSVDLDGDDADEDEEDPTLADDEEWLHNKGKKKKANYTNPNAMCDPQTLEKMRKNRLNEVQMWRIVREIASYGVFLYILIILSFDNRDPNSFYLRDNLEGAFIKQGDMTDWKSDLDFSKVHDTATFWTWTQNVVMQELRAQNWYDGKTPPYGMRGFLDDRVNRIMGYGMIRQVRAKPNTCTVHAGFADRIKKCSGFSGVVDEETGNFCANWTRTGSRKDCRPEWRYMTASELDSLPYIGSLDIYGGGGYVMKLTGYASVIARKLEQLKQERWIDHLTRAVLVEFSVYNAQVNLFGIGTIFVEAVPGGGLLPGWRFDGVRLMRHNAGFNLFVLICEITYMLFIIYFMVREIRDMIKQKKAYFNTYWVYAEWSVILLSWTAFIVYILRYIETDSVLETFKKTYGNGYIKMQYAQTLDDYFGYLVGMLVFIATIKFSKLLRFNRRIGMLSATLKQCWGDLTGFFLIFFIALGTFAMVFHMLLITHMDDYKNIVSAVESAFAMLLNKFDFEAMYKANILAVVLFLFFAISMSIFFVNVLLTIIIRAFQQVKDDVLSQPNDFEILEFVQMRMIRFLGLGQKRIVPLRVQMKEFQEEQRRLQNTESSVDQLPGKMNQFLNQVNHKYFDGKLQLDNKQFLVKMMNQQQERERQFAYSGEQASKKKPRANDNDRSQLDPRLMELDEV